MEKRYAHQVEDVIIDGSLTVAKFGRPDYKVPIVMRVTLKDKSTLILQFDPKTGKLNNKRSYV